MASPVGHSLMGISIYLGWRQNWPRREEEGLGWRCFMPAILLANLPDLDLLIGLLFYGSHTAIHGEVTHGLLFALLVSLMIGIIFRSRGFLHLWLLSLLLIMSHDFMDAFSAQDLGFTRGEGVAFLAPFSFTKFGSSVSIFYGVRHEDLSQLFSLVNLWHVLFELGIFLPIAGYFLIKHRERAKQHR